MSVKAHLVHWGQERGDNHEHEPPPVPATFGPPPEPGNGMPPPRLADTIWVTDASGDVLVGPRSPLPTDGTRRHYR